MVADHADVIHDLLGCERKLTDALERTRARLDIEFIAAQASRAPSKELAYALQERDGGPQTATDLERLARLLRQRTTIAHRRAAKGVGKSEVGVGAGQVHVRANEPSKEPNMSDPFLRKRRIIEEEFGPPPGGLNPDVEDLNGADDDEFDGDDDDPADHDLGDRKSDLPGNKSR